MQPLTRGPEADETKTMTVAWPHHACVPLSKRRQHHLARSTCAAASNVRSSPLGADTVCKSRNSFADALFTQGLMALMPPIVCCVRAQSAREFVTEFSGGATPHRSGVAQS
jgi:dihydroorotase